MGPCRLGRRHPLSLATIEYRLRETVLEQDERARTNTAIAEDRTWLASRREISGLVEQVAQIGPGSPMDRDRAMTSVRAALQTKGMTDAMAAAHLEGAALLIENGHDLDDAANRRKRRSALLMPPVPGGLELTGPQPTLGGASSGFLLDVTIGITLERQRKPLQQHQFAADVRGGW